ncbi:hypothetical protein GYH30_000844 [Glycine max]|nr:hypothetical protein GYH30_000844 [Glycine max]
MKRKQLLSPSRSTDNLNIDKTNYDPFREGDKKESAPCYNCKIDLPPDNLYKFDHIKAKMKNGDVFVPKIKDKERKDAINVKVE